MDTAKLIELVQGYAIEFAPKVAAAIVVLIIGRWVAKGLTKVVEKALTRVEADDMLVKFVGNIAYALLMTVVLLAALAQVGVQTTSFLAILGAAGLAIGLALKDSLANFAAGVMVILFRPYKTGDFVEAGGVSGTVREVQIFTTVLTTPDNKKVIVPNGQITAGTITNFSAFDTRRVDMVFGIGYDDDVKAAKNLLMQIVEADERVHGDPAPQVFVKELADSSVNFGVRVWVNASDYWGVMFDTTETVKLRFDEEGISIPFPQQDVHMHQVVSEKAA
ncbi:MAG: mechanosensitive ion channel domain-containing protein [Pseudomonadota bacterium]